jgi:hypothetical protein
MCPQNSNIFRLISLLNPAISAEEVIITATLRATASTAIRMISLEKFLPLEKAILLAIKKGKFMSDEWCRPMLNSIQTKHRRQKYAGNIWC